MSKYSTFTFTCIPGIKFIKEKLKHNCQKEIGKKCISTFPSAALKLGCQQYIAKNWLLIQSIFKESSKKIMYCVGKDRH